eukprot:TRINITY_DN3245_c0_g1_i2.p2 TRINITY_DN3245_c0_g1~~TRINITY_DN3245_c0_g1_i2.p2  ORF type:complete len:104 (+),score=32.44 TRINITY_DN3245_c0_g1_i2:31-312(+)
MVLNSRISCAVDDLRVLHEARPWLPGAENIRPSAETRASKAQYLQTVRASYAAESDYVLHTVFRLAPLTDQQGRFYFERPLPNKALKVFDNNM